MFQHDTEPFGNQTPSVLPIVFGQSWRLAVTKSHYWQTLIPTHIESNVNGETIGKKTEPSYFSTGVLISP